MNAHSGHSTSEFSPRTSTGCWTPSRLRLPLAVWLLCLLFVNVQADSARVKLIRTPYGGIQPQAMVDSKGLVHLIYFKGEPARGDIFYVRQAPGNEMFSKPIQVNSRPGSAIAVGTIRGAQMALGRNGRVHLAWNGNPPGSGDYMKAPMLYARLDDAGSAFEPERDMITNARGLDGGGSVAADKLGNVYVTWHAPKPGNLEGETGRAVFVVHSADDGKTFAREKLAAGEPTGACGCCGMKAFADSQGNVFALYRGASEKVNRDEILLVSRNRGADFQIALAHPWKIGSCPMSSAWFSETKAGTLAAWETEDKIYFARVNPKTLAVSEPVTPPGSATRKHPIAVGNEKGEVLVVWTEGTGWQRGGAAAWQLFDANLQPTSDKGRADGVPVWSLVAAATLPNGNFVIFY